MNSLTSTITTNITTTTTSSLIAFVGASLLSVVSLQLQRNKNSTQQQQQQQQCRQLQNTSRNKNNNDYDDDDSHDNVETRTSLNHPRQQGFDNINSSSKTTTKTTSGTSSRLFDDDDDDDDDDSTSVSSSFLFPTIKRSKKEEVLFKRKQYFSKSLSISYANTDPLMIVKGIGSHLIDENGISYLDTRNNVAHCGHCHPKIVQAIQNQVAILNTNTRYIHPIMTELAERLLELVPKPLEIVFFCNSGSEANDLALRLARSYSNGSNNTIIVDHAYHGHTIATLEVSPYKYEHEPIIEYKLQSLSSSSGISFQSPGHHIWKVPCPDIYTGIHRDNKNNTAGTQYAKYVQEACNYYQSKEESVRAFIIEGGMSVAGVIIPPSGYIHQCVTAVRNAGGLYIADEIQTGFGRLGNVMWAFQMHGNNDVIPDIVTVGKPFGNGMPLAAVITTREVATAFENCQIEYFNTFGGNPVCCVAGLTMLNVLRDEKLQDNALKVGNYMKERLIELQKQYPIIGDIRGSGLFIGIHFVQNQKTREPATTETSYICSLLKTKYHILTSIDGPHNNVLVIKPPMVFTVADTDYFMNSLDEILKFQLHNIDVQAISNTPT